jgi:hypothetical protein
MDRVRKSQPRPIHTLRLYRAVICPAVDVGQH